MTTTYEEAVAIFSCDLDFDSRVIYVRGDFDHANAPKMIESVRFMTLEDEADLTVDLGDVTFMCSAGLEAILLTSVLLSSIDRELHLTRVSPRARRLFELGGLTHLLD